MAKSIYQTAKLTVGKFGLGLFNDKIGQVKQEVNDGDTISVRSLGNFGVRLLGVDAPESRLPLNESIAFYSTGGDVWKQYVQGLKMSNFSFLKDINIRNYLKDKINDNVMTNHYINAKNAERAFEEELFKDIEILEKDNNNFELFLVFAHEVMDSYGRLLCFLNRYEPEIIDENLGRPLTYNERLLKNGFVLPYFIWPNINPFRKKESIVNAVVEPYSANSLALNDSSLRNAREWVKIAQQKKIGLYSEDNLLILEPFEVRFLSRQEPPTRYIIDLSKNEDIIYWPEQYFKISNSEDRLFIPEEYLPLFISSGWRLSK